MNMKQIVLAALAAGLAFPIMASSGPWEAPQKKIIGSSWDLTGVTPEDLLEHADLFDQTGMDGFVIHVPNVTDETGKVIRLESENGIMGSPHVSEQTLGPKVAVLKKLTSEHKSFRHSFFGCNWSPIMGKRFAWSDDAVWNRFAANMRVVASVAKRGGLVGIAADPEDYGKSQYWLQASEPPFDVTGPQARERGRQIGRAIFEEFPEAKIFCYWFFSLDKSYAYSDDPAAAMRAKGDLWPMFLNGLLDVMPPTARLVDGDEHGYWYKSGEHAFEASSVRTRTRALALVAPENRAKYRAQLSIAFGQYLDEYINPKKVSYRTKNGSALEAFRDCLGEALYASDEYVWFWAEKAQWVAWKNFKPPYGWMKIGKETWEQRLPGLAQMLTDMKNPAQATARKLDALRAAKAPNLLASALLNKGSNWQSEKRRQGTFTPQPGQGTDGGTSVLAKGVEGGCFVLDVPNVKDGEMYLVEGYMRGQGIKAFTVRWKKNGGWSWATPGSDAAFGEPDAQGWRRAFVTVCVPQGMNGLTLKIDLAQGADESAVLDRAVVYKLD